MTRRHTRPGTAAQALLGLLLLALTLAGCTPRGGGSQPAGLPPADEAVRQIAAALERLDLGQAPVVEPAAAQKDLEVVTDGMGSLRPTVAPGAIEYDAAHRTARATLRWSWPTVPQKWTYESQAPLTLDGTSWKLAWAPSVVNEHVTTLSRIEVERVQPKRGTIYGNGGKPLVTYRDVVKIGIDKTKVAKADQDKSARALATVLKEDPEAFAKEVADAGERAFVVCLTIRGRTAPDGVGGIPGAFVQLDKMILASNKGFAAPVLGAVAEATKEMIEKSGGKYAAGDIVGVSGIQKTYDDQLRGSAGLNVLLVKRQAPAPSPVPAGSPTPTPTLSPTPSGAQMPLPATLFEVKKVDGQDLTVTLDEALQIKAEDALRDNPQPMAFAIVQPSTGKLLALAVSPAANGEPLANYGRYAPGSTFKIATSLGLIRAGLTPDSMVECPQKITVDGREITNYPGYPDEYAGTQPLKNFVAYSCNTVFVQNMDKLGEDGLARAAASLGIGVDYDTGFQGFYGEVPKADSKTGRAEQTFGQGTVLESPMSVAAMSASVAAKRTVVPYLVEGHQAQPKGDPLTPAEAAQLQALMENVVAMGTAKNLQGLAVGAKTGTAEFGDDPKALKQHLWVTGYTANDMAFAIFQNEGKLSLDLAPIIKQVLS